MTSCTLKLRVTPRSKKEGISVTPEGQVKLHIKAPPVDGKANKACQDFLASYFNISKSKVTLKQGGQSRDKTFILEGISEKEMNEKIGK